MKLNKTQQQRIHMAMRDNSIKLRDIAHKHGLDDKYNTLWNWVNGRTPANRYAAVFVRAICAHLKLDKKLFKESIEAIPDQSMGMIDEMEYAIVRTKSDGVYAGFLESLEGQQVVLRSSKRIWRNNFRRGHMALEEESGLTNCRVSAMIDKIILTEATVIMPCKAAAMDSLLDAL